MEKKGSSSLFLAAAIYATFGILIREMSHMFGTNAQIAFRFTAAFILVLILNVYNRRKFAIKGRALYKALALGASFATVLIFFTVSVTTTKIANSVFLLYAGSIISSLGIGTIIFKEKLTKVKVMAIAISLFGLSFYSHAFLTLSLGVVTGLLSGIFDGISNSLRKSLKGVDRHSLLLVQFSFGAFVSLVIGLLIGEAFIKTFVLSSLLVGVVFGILQVLLNNLLLYGFQHFDVNVGTVILATELFFATVLGYLFFKEVPAINEIIGGLLIFIASIISSVDFKLLYKKLFR